jgi:hypothetical protein
MENGVKSGSAVETAVRREVKEISGIVNMAHRAAKIPLFQSLIASDDRTLIPSSVQL